MTGHAKSFRDLKNWAFQVARILGLNLLAQRGEANDWAYKVIRLLAQRGEANDWAYKAIRLLAQRGEANDWAYKVILTSGGLGRRVPRTPAVKPLRWACQVPRTPR
jgi:hypothetical protein